MTEIKFWDRNENKSKDFIEKLYDFTSNEFKLSIKWVFSINGKNMYSSRNIYRENYTCKGDYIGETEFDLKTCWGKYKQPNAWLRTSTVSLKQPKSEL